ncbi:MAG: hypothetical protein ACI4I3_00875 [Acutalibacteraceae bacterium]
MKTMKRTVSLLICAVMVATTIFGAGLASLLKAEAADITLGGITQQRVVENYETTYANYAEQFFLGSETNGPTNMVLPGLSSTDNYVQQGLTYYAAKNWVLISAYDNSGSSKSTCIFALDATSGDFVAIFRLLNADGSINATHGGGLAASAKNLYYTDTGSNISYFPLSELDVPVGTAKDVKFVDTVSLSAELGGANTSYCSFDDGILWTGNFYYSKNTSNDTVANPDYTSMILGYKISGENSEIEWNSFKSLVGNPTYCIGTNIDKIQYAMVHDGKIFVSRSWDRLKSGANHIHELRFTNMDITATGNTTITVNGVQRQGYTFSETSPNSFAYNSDNMINMSEAFCFINNVMYIFSETSAWKYNGGETNVADNPIDVIWRIDINEILRRTYYGADDSRIYTNLSTELQADGTYTVNLETYSVEKNHQKALDSQRPTDYIIVMDASYSGSNKDATGRACWGWDNTLSIGAVAGSSNIKDPGGSNKTTGTDLSTGDIFYRTSDGVYRQLYAGIRTTTRKTILGFLSSIQQYYWVYYIGDDGLCYVLHTDGSVSAGVTQATLENDINNANGTYSAGSSDIQAGDREDTVCYKGMHYGKETQIETIERFFAIRDTAEALAKGIMSESQSSGLDNRIALVQYGSGSSSTGTDNTGFYTTDGSMVTYGSASATSYAKAFFPADNYNTVLSFIRNMRYSTNNDYTYSGLGFEMAKGIVDNSDANYLSTSGRNLCVIVLNDGGLGKDSTAATEMANIAVSNAFKLKESGAYVYSIKYGGHTISGFNPDQYLEAISSDYVRAQSYSDLGDRNTESIEYKINASSAVYIDYSANSYAQTVLSDSFVDSKNAKFEMNASSVIKQTLSDSFIIPDDAQITTKLVPSSIDGTGNVTFGTPVVTNTVITGINGQTLTASGYSYSENYVAANHNGNKLLISISGVLPNTANNLTDANISDAANSGVYENQTEADNNNALTRFPNDKVNIPEYTYVLDYGVPVYDSGLCGTALSVVDTAPQKLNSYSNNMSNDNISVGITDGDIFCSLNPGASLSESSGYIFTKNTAGEYEWIKVNLVPASNVLYEESSFVLDDSGATSWATVGTPSTAGQSVSTSNDVYGYDDAYNNTNQYSNGSALTATVDSTNKKSDKATFEFTGTGFDLVSACGPNTGVEVITVKQGTDIKKVFIIDTYYNDSAYGTLYQVPIASYSDAYGTYTVETTAAYLSFAGALNQGTVQTASIDGTEIEASSAQPDAATASELLAQLGMEELAGEDVEVIWMDDNSIFNGGTGVQGSTVSTQAAGDSGVSLVNYIDGFRIYNPLTDEQAAKYYPASEQGAEYYNIIGSLTSGNGNISGDSSNWLAYVEGSNGTFGFGDYKANGGPKNEVYLSSADGNGLAFSIEIPQNSVASARVMLSMRSASGTPNVKINGYDVNVISSTEMYYDITNILIESGQITSAGGSVTITINNNGGGLLALDNIKLVNCNTGTLSTDSISDVSAMMSAPSVHIGLESLTSSVNGYSYNYDNSNADPEGEINPEPEQPNAIDEVLNRIVTFLQNAFEFVKTAFVKFIGFFNLLKF